MILYPFTEPFVVSRPDLGIVACNSDSGISQPRIEPQAHALANEGQVTGRSTGAAAAVARPKFQEAE